MNDKQIIKKYRKREKELGAWMAERGYDAWNIFHKDQKLTRLIAITKNPIGVMIKNNPCFGYNWDDIRAIKLT